MELQADKIFPITRYSLKCVLKMLVFLLVRKKTQGTTKKQILAVDVGADNNKPFVFNKKFCL